MFAVSIFSQLIFMVLSHVQLVSDKSRNALLTMNGLHLQAAHMEIVVTCEQLSEFVS